MYLDHSPCPFEDVVIRRVCTDIPLGCRSEAELAYAKILGKVSAKLSKVSHGCIG